MSFPAVPQRPTQIARLLAFGILVCLVAINAYISWPREVPDIDYGVLRADGRAILQGQVPYESHFRYLTGDDAPPNLNVPLLLPMLSAMAAVPPATGYRILWALSLAVYSHTAFLMTRHFGDTRPIAIMACLAFGPLWNDLLSGQIYVLWGTLGIWAYLLLERQRPVSTGVLIGLLAAIKPQFLVWPTLLLLGRCWRPALSSIVTFLLASLCPLLLYGPSIYGQWWRAAAAWAVPQAYWPHNMALPALGDRWGLGVWGLASAIIMLLVLAWIVWRHQPDMATISALSILGAILAGPIAWVSYVFPLLPWMVRHATTPAVRVLWALLLVPVYALSEPPVGRLMSTAYPVGALAVLLSIGWHTRGTSTRAAQNADIPLIPPTCRGTP